MTHLGSTNWVAIKRLLLYIYIYVYIPIYRDVQGCLSAKWLRILKNKNHMSSIFGLSIFFVEEPPPYLQQGDHKTAYVENIYTRLRLSEPQTARNMEKQKTTCPLFLNSPSF